MTTTATVTFYSVVLFVHISGVVLAFGPTYGYAFFQATAERTDPRSLPTILRSFQQIDRTLVSIGTLFILASGIYLVADSPAFDWEDVFVSAGIVILLGLIGLVHGFFRPNTAKLLELAERDIKAAGDGEVQLSDEYQAVSQRVGRVGTLAGLLVILTVYMMAAKPFL